MENPLENLDWLKAYEPNPYSSNAADIYYVRYKNADYIADDCGNLIEIFDCSGKPICTVGGVSGQYCDIWTYADKKVLLNKRKK